MEEEEYMAPSFKNIAFLFFHHKIVFPSLCFNASDYFS